MAYGRPAVVVQLLPREAGRARAARATHDPPCRVCERGLQYEDQHRHWRCPDCHTTYGPTALAAVCLAAERSARAAGVSTIVWQVSFRHHRGRVLGRRSRPDRIAAAALIDTFAGRIVTGA